MPRFDVNGRSPAAFLLNSTRVIRRDDTITHGSVRWSFYDGAASYGSGSGLERSYFLSVELRHGNHWLEMDYWCDDPKAFSPAEGQRFFMANLPIEHLQEFLEIVHRAGVDAGRDQLQRELRQKLGVR